MIGARWMTEVQRLRYDFMVDQAQRYAWWLGSRSAIVRRLLTKTGRRVSRFGYQILGRPTGALAWPMGLAFLVLNSTNEFAQQEVAWIERCFAGIMDSLGRTRLPGFAVDQGGLGYAALRLAELTGDARYFRFSEELGKSILNLPGAADGCITYAIGHKEILVDSAAFICPFLARLSRMNGDQAFSNVAVAQLETISRCYDNVSEWAYHGFDAETCELIGISGWGRGVGWLLIGSVDTVAELPLGETRSRLSESVNQLLKRFRDIQSANGHWPWHLDCPGSESDSSVTALVAYATTRWRQIEKDQTAWLQEMQIRCQKAINAVTDTQGRVGQCSGEAGGGGHYSSHFGTYMWAQAPAVAAERIAQLN